MKFFIVVNGELLQQNKRDTTSDVLQAGMWDGHDSMQITMDNPGLIRTQSSPMLIDALNESLKRADKLREMLTISHEQ